MKRSAKKNIGLILLFIVGLSILLYPTVSNTWNEYRAKQLISEYTSVVQEKEDPKLYEAMRAAAEDYNRKLSIEEVPDAFSVRDGIRDEEYDSLLNMNDSGMMGFVEIPTIDVELPIFHYTNTESLEKGAGHLFGSSLPVGGESTHTVLSAHRGLPSAKLFTDLPLLEEGDDFYIKMLGETLAYRVDQILTVEPSEVEALSISEGEDLATLVTCTPYGVNSHRVLVRGHRIPFEEEVYEEEQTQTVVKKDTGRLAMQALCVLAGLLIALVIVGFLNRRELRRKDKRKRHGRE